MYSTYRQSESSHVEEGWRAAEQISDKGNISQISQSCHFLRQVLDAITVKDQLFQAVT